MAGTTDTMSVIQMTKKQAAEPQTTIRRDCTSSRCGQSSPISPISPCPRPSTPAPGSDRPKVVADAIVPAHGTDNHSVYTSNVHDQTLCYEVDDDGYASAPSSTRTISAAQPGIEAAYRTLNSKTQAHHSTIASNNRITSEHGSNAHSHLSDLSAAGPSLEPSAGRHHASSTGSTTLHRTHVRYASHSVSDYMRSNSIQSYAPAQGNLRTLLLPDMLRAKGVRLVSTSELSSSGRSRTELSSSGRSRSLSSPSSGGHRRTLSMPAHMGQQQHRPFQDLLLAPGEEGYKRDSDLDTVDDGGITYDKFGDTNLELSETFQARNDLNNHPLHAGLGRRCTLGNGSAAKPVRLTFRPDSCLVNLEYEDKKSEVGEGATDEGTEDGDIIIEAWVVDDASFDEVDLEAESSVEGLFGFHNGLNYFSDLSDPQELDIPSGWNGILPDLVSNGDNPIAWMQSLPFIQYEEQFLEDEAADDDKYRFLDNIEEGDLPEMHHPQEVWATENGPEQPNILGKCPSYTHSMPNLGASESTVIMCDQSNPLHTSNPQDLPMTSMFPFPTPLTELKELGHSGSMVMGWNNSDGENWHSYESFPSFPTGEPSACSPFTQYIKEIRPYRHEAWYPISKANEAEGECYETETLCECEYRGRIYRAEKDTSRRPSGGREKQGKRSKSSTFGVSSSGSLHGCRPRSALDRRVGAWRRLKEAL